MSHDPSEIIIICRFAAQETEFLVVFIKKIFFYFFKQYTAIQKCRVQYVKLIKSDSKDIYNATKYFYFKKMYLSFHKNIKQQKHDNNKNH